MATVAVEEHDGTWLWRLRDDEVLAQGVHYAERSLAEADLDALCSVLSVPAVVCIVPGRWAWAFEREGRRYGTAARAFDSADAALAHCIDALLAWHKAVPFLAGRAPTKHAG